MIASKYKNPSQKYKGNKGNRREANRQRMVLDSQFRFPSLVSIFVTRYAFPVIEYVQRAC
jgi:riboflavin biosynthesis pyrimidine reductase